MSKINNKTIFDVIREIGSIVNKDNERDKKINLLLKEAYNMGEKITKKILEYNPSAKVWENKDI